MFEQMILSAVGELKQTFLVQFCQLEKLLDIMCENKVPKGTIPFGPNGPFLQRYVDAGLLDANWQPNHLSWPQSALLAKDIADRLHIDDVWQQFGQLWNVNPQTLRSYYNRAMNQKKTLQFLDTLKKVHQTQI